MISATVANVPIRGAASVTVKTMKAPPTAPSHIHFGAAAAVAKPPSERVATSRTTRRDDRGHDARERDRRHGAHAFAEAAEDRHLRRGRKAGAERESRSESVTAGHGEESKLTIGERADAPPPDPARAARLRADRYEKAPPRATITLNRPEVLNAFDFQMLRELARACEDASWDDEIRVVVVTGEGRAFCVGADLRAGPPSYLGKPREYWKWFGAFKDMHDRLREIGKPTVARVKGIAVGGGNELQMACDLAVMVDDAFIRHVGPSTARCRPAARRSGCRLWSATAARARSCCSARRSRRSRPPSGGSSTAPCPRAELDAVVDDWSRSSRRSCRRRPVHEAAAQLVARHLVARDGRPRARLARRSRCSSDEANEAMSRFLEEPRADESSSSATAASASC